MVNNRPTTSYEILVLQGGRWELHGRYSANERLNAVNEAKILDSKVENTAVKVIKETYDPDSAVNREVTIFRSTKNRLDPPGRSRSGAAYGRDRNMGARYHGPTSQATAAFAGAHQTTAPPPSTSWGILSKLVLTIVFSITVAALLTGMASVFMRNFDFVAQMVGTTAYGNTLFVIFVLSFLATGIPMAIKFLSSENLRSAPPTRVAPKRHVPAKPQSLLPPIPNEPPPPSATEDTAAQDTEEPPSQTPEEILAEFHRQQEELKKAAAPEPEPEPAPEPEPEPEATPETASEPEAEPEPEPEPIPLEERVYEDLVQRPEKRDTDPAEPDADIPLDDADDPLKVEAQKVVMMTFLGEALNKVHDSRIKLDNFNKFGVNLFLSGASEVLASERALSQKGTVMILLDAVQVLGTPLAQAKSFSEKYENYLLADTRYLQMFGAGREAMTAFLAEYPDAVASLVGALAEWNRPKTKEDAPGPVTLMFTDIVGSTDMTQEMGDAAAQEIVRTHNRIVRGALTAKTGKEIKHMGDGIMASFSRTASAVEAAALIQEQIEMHNEVTPKKSLRVRIGINAGEPIVEDNDLFGTVVQLAARLCAKASADEIFVSDVVRGICAGKKLTFIERGPVKLKGFKEPVPIFEVDWSGKIQAAAKSAETTEADKSEGTTEADKSAETTEADKSAETTEADKSAETAEADKSEGTAEADKPQDDTPAPAATADTSPDPTNPPAPPPPEDAAGTVPTDPTTGTTVSKDV